MKATQELHAQGLTNVVFRQLGIASPASVMEFVAWIKETFVGLDILVCLFLRSHLPYELE